MEDLHQVMEETSARYCEYRIRAPHVEHLGAAQDVRIHSDRVMSVWVLGILTRGQMHVAIGPDQGTIGPGAYYLMPPEVRHWGTREGVHDVVWFTFSAAGEPAPPLAPSAASAHTPADFVQLPVLGRMPPEFDHAAHHRFLQQALDLGQLSPAAADRSLAVLLDQMHVQAQRERLRLDPQRRLALDLLQYLRTRRCASVDSSELARAFRYSYAHLNRVFRNAFGVSLQRRHMQLRMDAALERLIQGATIQETAAAVGFEDYYYFLKVFKRAKGITPTQAVRQGS